MLQQARRHALTVLPGQPTIVHHKEILSQTDGRSSYPISDEDHIKYLANSHCVFGSSRDHPERHQPARDQLSCLNTVVKLGHNPNADFAMFIPHQQRAEKAVKLRGSRAGSQGELIPIEVVGPL